MKDSKKVTMGMTTLNVYIEEHLCKCISVPIPKDADLYSDVVQTKIKEIHTKYRNGDIILSSDDFNGVVLTSSCIADGSNGKTTNWTTL